MERVTGACVVIPGGVDVRRDVAFSADFSLLGDRVISCGMDHLLELWNLTEPVVVEAIETSYSHEPSWAGRTAEVCFPEFPNRDIHRNYVD